MNITSKPVELIFTILVAAIFLSVIPGITYADKADLDSDKSIYIVSFSGDSLEDMKEKAKMLEWKGYSDPEIFDLVEINVLKNMNVSDKQQVDAVAWLVKALSFSGNQKYLPAINKVAIEGNEKLRRHASNAAKELQEYTSHNAIISKNLSDAPAGRLDQQRVMNMLKSNNSELVRIGVREVYDHYTRGSGADQILLDEVKALLLANLSADSRDSTMEDAIAWMCKTMGATGDARYKAVLDEVIAKSTSAKIKKYASKSL